MYRKAQHLQTVARVAHTLENTVTPEDKLLRREVKLGVAVENLDNAMTSAGRATTLGARMKVIDSTSG